MRAAILVTLAVSVIAACAHGGSKSDEATPSTYEPLARARAALHARPSNPDASVPLQCYASTAGGRGGCWTCHTQGQGPNPVFDGHLQESYSFSEFAKVNRWRNAVTPAPATPIDDGAILAWIRGDNYRALKGALAAIPLSQYPGFRPDLDLDAGLDADGFAKDGSRWRAIRYKPFPGAFFPTNGGAGDVFVRLPLALAKDRPTELRNFATLEAAIRGDGGLPSMYEGSSVAVEAQLFPQGTEILHTVRYLDPDAPNLLSRRLKELRWMKKAKSKDVWARNRAHEKAIAEKEENTVPVYAGNAVGGLENAQGWLLQAFIEDELGRLRLQTDEEHRACMGCHGSLGVTVDATFSFARKVPGADGYRWQDLGGMKDAPMRGHADPEILTWLRRLGAGDELGGNDELAARFFPGGVLAEAEVRRAAKGGDRDLAWLLAPSRARALALDKAYLRLVRAQRFELGRDALLGKPPRLLARIESEETGLVAAKAVHLDARLVLDW
ncbi:MAG: hypothetical protein JNL79_19965 [Myxococcales bacterium]|nr:hypothetical protein [Myxococcales bacterium]